MEIKERLKTGLSALEVQAAKEQYGLNVLTPPPSTPWWKLLLEKFQDPIIMILVAAAIVSIIVGIIEGNLIEPIGILIAIGLATGVGFWMEWSAKKKFDILNQTKDGEPVKVIRGGNTLEIPKTDLVPGDVVILATGDEVPADIDLYQATNLKIDESAMTGESVPASKGAKEGNEDWGGSGFAPWEALRGTRVMEGSGLGIITKTGDNTEIGKTTRAAMEETHIDTPLQKQLDGLASLINKAAFSMAGLLLILLNVHHWVFAESVDPSFMGILTTELRFLMMAVVLIVVSVPEGLPLSTVISLAFSMKKMMSDNSLVRKMHACETIGAVNVIFSDKTGTLTQNKMTVVETHIGNGYSMADIVENAAINSSASLGASGETVGNPSEGAMLRYIEHQGISWKDIRENSVVTSQKPFNSTDKYMSSTVESGIIYVKGAPEVVAGLVGFSEFLEVVEDQQARGRRAISCAQGTSMDHLEYTGTFFVEDPVRPDVPEAVKTCRRAGIDVVMVTGDNIKTAKEIGRQAGLADDPWAIEAKDFDDVAWGDPNCGYPQVIARCKPSDKLHILQKFQELHYVCAMTGDGVNDSPSLNHADVGIAMGSGTSVAKEAGDIVLLDDAFPSIVTGVKWGRSLYKNIQSFLTYQLTINVVFCLTVLFGPILGIDLPFSLVQGLLTNLCMDTLAALCLASEPADSNVLFDKPRPHDAFIITPNMWKTIFGLGGVVTVILSIMIWNTNHPGLLPFTTDSTIMFASFMVFNWWNLFNARVFGKNRSIFHEIGKSGNFLLGSAIILIGTILAVQFGGEIVETHPLTVCQWLAIILATSPVVIIRELWFWITKKH